MISNRLKLPITVVLVAAVVTALVLQRRTIDRLRAEKTDLQARADQLSDISEALRQATTGTAPELDDPGQTSADLMRLRAEVSRLRQQAKSSSAQALPTSDQPLPETEILDQVNVWNERIEQRLDPPISQKARLEELFQRLRANDTRLANYELLFKGSLQNIANPHSAIVIRERGAEQTPDGHWIRSYHFADGHLARIASADGDFNEFEARHQVQLVDQ